MRRLLKANFTESDLWICLKYPRGERPDIDKVKKDLKAFDDRIRPAFKKQGVPYKWIRRVEIGSRGGIHIHMVINRATDADKLIKAAWKPGGVHFTLLYDSWDFDELAAYIVKEPDEKAAGQMELFETEDKKKLLRYSSSRNLIRPEPVKEKTYSRRTMRKIITDGPKASDGYYIDKNSVRCGTNPVNGKSYLHYTEIKAREGGRHGQHIYHDKP